MRRVRLRVLAITLTLAVLGSIASGGSGRAAIDRTAKVVVIKSGVVPGGERSGYAQYALVLRNRSSGQDALDVSVEVEALDARGNEFTSSYSTITLIPAATNFVITDALIWGGSVELAGIKTEVHVGQAVPKGRTLPRVKNVAVTRRGDITGSLTNRYKRSLPESATVYGVVLDSRGRIVAAGADLADVFIRPGATARFDIFGNVSPTAQLDAATSWRVSVDPCGYLAFTRVCPVSGAQN